MNISDIYKINAKLFRGKRFQKFIDKINPSSGDAVLDIGGTKNFWKNITIPFRKVDIVNLVVDEDQSEMHQGCELRWMAGDARNLPFEDGSYDIVFSNSVIEHVGTWEDQQAFAKEALRLGRHIWIQTPAREFPIEPHYLTAFLHWFPKSFQRKTLRYFSIWGLVAKPAQDQVDAIVDEIRLISFREMKELFPDCKIFKERFLGVFVKSYSAFR